MSAPGQSLDGGLAPPRARPRGFSAGLVLAGGALACIVILIALGVTLHAVFWRYVAGRPVNWSDELTGYLVVGMVAAGLGSALLGGAHIGIDLLAGLAGPRMRRALATWSALSVLLTAGIVGWSAWHSTLFARDFGLYSNGYMEVAMWKVQAPLVAGAGLLALAALTLAWGAVRGQGR